MTYWGDIVGHDEFPHDQTWVATEHYEELLKERDVLVERLEAAQEAAQKNWDEHSERQLAALDRDPERELRSAKGQIETLYTAIEYAIEKLSNMDTGSALSKLVQVSRQWRVVDGPDGEPVITSNPAGPSA